MTEEKPQDPRDLKGYVNWLNEEKFKERKGILTFLTTISTALLAFTISFRKDVAGDSPHHIEYLKAHWLLLLIAIALSVAYYFLEVRYMFYQRVSKVTNQVPCTHYAGKVERCIFVFAVYTTPATFLAAIATLTIFVLLNTK
jgi:multisubunit Na+/H+ antiporter MnhB subunit